MDKGKRESRATDRADPHEVGMVHRQGCQESGASNCPWTRHSTLGQRHDVPGLGFENPRIQPFRVLPR
jgi:hypothetical protein